MCRLLAQTGLWPQAIRCADLQALASFGAGELALVKFAAHIPRVGGGALSEVMQADVVYATAWNTLPM